MRGKSAQSETDVDPLDHEHVTLELDLALGLGDQTIDRRRHLTRFQRASEGSGQSTGGRGDDIVERGRVRLDLGADLVVSRDRAVDTENDGHALRREIGLAQRPFHALDPHLGTIDDGI